MANPIELISNKAPESKPASLLSTAPETLSGSPTQAFWNKNGFSRDYDVGKLYGSMGNANDGNMGEFFTKFANLLIVLVNQYSKDSKTENTTYTETYDIFRAALAEMVKMAGMNPTVQNNARFLASMQGFFDGYIKNTGITGRL